MYLSFPPMMTTMSVFLIVGCLLHYDKTTTPDDDMSSWWCCAGPLLCKPFCTASHKTSRCLGCWGGTEDVSRCVDFTKIAQFRLTQGSKFRPGEVIVLPDKDKRKGPALRAPTSLCMISRAKKPETSMINHHASKNDYLISSWQCFMH